MKFHYGFMLLAALGTTTGAMASAVAPSITGTVTQVTPRGTDSRVTINGHTYTVTRQTRSSNAPASGSASLQPGQKVTLFLSGDGHSVIMIQAPDTRKKQP